MKNLNKLLLPLMLSPLMIISCDHTNSRKMTPPEVRDTSGKAEGEISELKISNAVDILFVIDNSESMKAHQQNLAHNIHRLMQAFEDNKSLDYHIGITTVFDQRYGYEITNFNPNGFLLPLKGDTHGQPAYYYTREHNDLKLLSKSLLVGILPLKDENGNYQGPEYEQILAPVLATFTEPALSSPTNQGFYRPDARLAVILITDADDSSVNLSGSDLDAFLRNLKDSPDGSKIMTFGLLAEKKKEKHEAEDKDNEEKCDKVDPGMTTDSPVQILRFLYASHQSNQKNVFSLCSKSFSGILEEIGKSIQEKTETQNIPLKEVPEHGTIKVFVAAQDYNDSATACATDDLPCQEENNKKKTDITHWSYDPVKNEIIINSIPKGIPPEHKFIKIKYTKVYMANVKNGRAKRY